MTSFTKKKKKYKKLKNNNCNFWAEQMSNATWKIECCAWIALGNETKFLALVQMYNAKQMIRYKMVYFVSLLLISSWIINMTVTIKKNKTLQEWITKTGPQKTLSFTRRVGIFLFKHTKNETANCFCHHVGKSSENIKSTTYLNVQLIF